MCVVSMVMDYYREKWDRDYHPFYQPNISNPSIPVRPIDYPTKAELDEFRRLLDRAREYDKRNNEPDCENDRKKKLLKDMAERLGVDISFIDQ